MWVPQSLSDEQVLFLSDIFPTGYMAADFCNLKGGETVAIWGCGPVGQFAIRSAFLLGAERVIAIDTVPERLALAQSTGAVTLDFRKEDIYDRIQEMTAAPRIKPTSTRCRSAWQPKPGRGSTYRRADFVQTSGTSSLRNPDPACL
jgi:threonine dehydrogenase-like Zn-dependent dehydrogenase